MEFDELISNGQLTKAARLFAKEYYDSGRMGHTRKLLIERLADKCDKYDAEIARQSAPSTETTSVPCEWCEGDVCQYFDVNWYDFIDGKRGNVNYCPYCGRRLENDNG